ncbi:hypothetical protein LTR28_001812 [Elasticomyces elasticus]|nr:hypothetical protein LTR28_001812 [Elasticomyces elasticus]
MRQKGCTLLICDQPKAAPAPASKATPAPSTPSQPPVTAPTPAAPAPAAQPPAAEPNPPATPSPAAPTTTSATPSRFDDPSQLALGEQRTAAIANMEAMGFARADIDRAMRAAFFNPDRAVEYLLTGIPESALREERPAQASPTPATNPTSPPVIGNTGTQATAAPAGDEPVNLFEAAAQAGQGGRGGGTARGGTAGGLGAALGGAGAGQGGQGGAAPNLEFLRNNPQFQQLRQVVQQQPAMLEPILQQVAAGNPQLAQIIGQHPEQFMQLLAEDADDDMGLPPGAQAVSVTEEEREAIERLCRLGFERDMVIQAYFACDKNEELAANFLFDQPDEPEE